MTELRAEPAWSVGAPVGAVEVSVPELIRRRARSRPDAPAVVQGAETLTYGELVGRARGLAAVLRGHGVAADDRIAVCARRRPGLLVAVLGVLFAGGAYVPTHPDDPRRRRSDVLADAGCRLAVVDEDGRAALAGDDVEPVDLTAAATAALPEVSLDQLAYVVYTSGSTGRPKGVMVEHRSFAEVLASTRAQTRITSGTRALGFASLGFDACLAELFTTLTAGGVVALASDADRVDPERLTRFCAEHAVNWALIPPQVLPLLDPGRLPDVVDVFTGAEAPAPAQVARWASPTRRFVNWYGPTESVMAAVGCELSGEWDTPVPIGEPMPGRRAYVLDDDLRPVPDGESGELFVGGVPLSRGYLDRPGRTAGSFLPDPFADAPGARMYRTGDLACRDSAGLLHFLGRLDRQVKIQGQRAELGEIEAALTAHPGVAQAAVEAVARPEGGVGIVAYLAPATAPDLDGVRAHCASRLPSYMVPRVVHRFAEFPLTGSAKVDLAALRELVAAEVGPDDDVELPARYAEVARAWVDVFGGARPAPGDDFLARGGHSLTAMRLVADLRRATGRAVSVEDVLAGRTVAGIAERVAACPAADADVPTGSPAALTAGQRQLWFVDRLAPDAGAYNVAMALRITGRLDVPALAGALAAVAARHEVLRWRITTDGGLPGVVVDPPGEPFVLPVDKAAADGVPAWLDARASAPFDTAAEPLWRARLLAVTDDEHVLAVTAHHAVFDGWSQAVYLRDLGAAYRRALAGANGGNSATGSAPTGGAAVRFADYARWRELRAESVGVQHLDWAVGRLDGAPFVLDLPRDRARSVVQTFRGERARRALTQDGADAVRGLARRLGTTPAVVLLAAFGHLLRRLTGSPDLVIGTPVADRQHPAFADVVGPLLDTVPLRLRIDDDAPFAAAVLACRDELLDTLAHRETPLARLVDRLGVPRDPARSPLFQVLFNVLNVPAPALDLPGATVEAIPPGVAGSPFDLTLYVHEDGPGIELEALYNPDLFGRNRIDALLEGYRALVGGLAADPEAPARRAALPPATGWAHLPTGDPEPILTRALAACAADPDGVAVAGPGTTITRAELAGRAGAVAEALQANGLRPGEVVAVLTRRDPWLPATLLGILAFGGRHTVLDAGAPPALLARQATAAGARALLPGASVDPPPELAHLSRPHPGGPTPPPTAPRPEAGAVTLTSGTTATPRAVAAGERAVAHFLDWYPKAWRLTATDRFAMTAGLGHDPLGRDVFLPLVLGATLHVPDTDTVRDPRRLVAWLAHHGITVWHATPQLARLLCAAAGGRTLPDLRLVAVGGDRLTGRDAADLRALAPTARLVNVYGTTETPQVHAYHELRGPGTEPVPVGVGAPGSQLVVLDADGRPAGVGELGEVVVRGAHLAEGYLRAGAPDEAATHRRFRRTPGRDDKDDRMFHTGDLGRHGPDGDIVLAGRADDQVKIRGHRVEPAEVEAVLAEHAGVAAAAVVPRDATLAAYAVPAGEVTAEELRRHLRERLPDHAVPATVTLLAQLPLTANFKLDRAALPDPVPPRADPPAGLAPTLTPTQRLVADVWRAVLGVPAVTLDVSFFEIGGHSMAIVEVANRLTAALGRQVDVVDLFRYVNVRSLAEALDRGGHDPAIDRAARRVAVRRSRRPDR